MRHWKSTLRGRRGKGGGGVGEGGPIMLRSKTVGGGWGEALVNPPLPVQLVLSIIVHLDTVERSFKLNDT